MSFLGSLLGRRKDESVALIDISAGSVAGAIGVYKKGELLRLVYERRLPIEIKEGEAHEKAMLRAVAVLGQVMVSEGLPALVRGGERGRVSRVLAAIDAPWQTTEVHHETVADKRGFVFTKRLVHAMVEKASALPANKVLTDSSILSVTLNGYETADPYGKEVLNASVLILTSAMDKEVDQELLLMIRKFFTSASTALISGCSMRYQAIREAFPHEQDLVIADVTGKEVVVTLVRKGRLAAVSERGDSYAQSKAADVVHKITDLAKTCPLARTVLILARDAEVEEVQKALEARDFAARCFLNVPPKVIPVLSSHISSQVKQRTASTPDLPLLLMALYQKRRFLNAQEAPMP